MRAPRALVVVAAGLMVAACGAPDRTAAVPRPTQSTAAPAAVGSTKCSPGPDATVSYAPPRQLPAPGGAPAGSTLATIHARGRLIVGISSDTRLLGARNLKTNAFEGLDIEMARRVAAVLFGADPDAHLTFRTISAAQRVPFLQDGSVDMVARAMTMTCDRWKQVEFSAPYFVATQRILVRRDSKEQSLPELAAAKKKVCATNGSTSIARLGQFTGVQVVGQTLTTDCMVLWQQGNVDAITGDDAILAGLQQQDPAAELRGPSNVEDEPYGLAVKHGEKEFAAFINGVLARMSNGDWQKAYSASGLQAVLGPRPQPTPTYGRG